MATCPVKSLPEWKALVEAEGEDMAYYLWDKYEGQVPQENVQYQLEELPASKSSPATIAKIKEAATKMGISIQKLSDYLRSEGVAISGVNAIADLFKGVVAIVENKEGVALTEETVHVATAILEQTNPSMITEMISKIGNFAIYRKTLEAYKGNKNYQLPDGKPDIRKIKKEAVDKLITELIINQNEGTTEFPELMEETVRSTIRNWWTKILSWFSGAYKKANIAIFEEVANKVIAGEVGGTVADIDSKEVFYQLSKAQTDFQRRIQETGRTLRKKESTEPVDPMFLDTEEASNWYELLVNGEWVRVKKRVTDRVKQWYEQKFPGKAFTPEEKAFNEFKRTTGLRGHAYFEEIHGRYFNNEDGTRRTTVTPRAMRLSITEEEVYNKLESYYVALIAKYSKDGKTPLVFSEVKLYDPKEKEAGTIDLLIVEEDGTAHIVDWKFMSVKEDSTDIAWYKQGAYNVQLGRYKDILMKSYGIKKIGMNRAIPIIMSIKTRTLQNKSSQQYLKGIAIGSVNSDEIEDLRLMPVSEETETTGEIALDKLIAQLNTMYRQIGKKKAASDEEREFKSKRLNIIKEAVRMAQGAENLSPLVRVIVSMREEGQMILNDYKTIYKDRPASANDLKDKELSAFSDEMTEYMSIAKIFEEVPQRIGDLIYNEAMEKEAKTPEEKEAVANHKEILENLKKEANLIWKSREEIKEVSGVFANKFIGERNLVTGLLNPEPIIKGLAATFRGVSDLPSASLNVLFKIVENAKSFASQTALSEVNELLAIRKKLEARGGDLRRLVQQVYQKDSKDKLTNSLIYKYDKKFFEGVDDNAKEGKQTLKWLKENIDVAAYEEEAKKHMEDNISYLEKKHVGDEKTLERLVEEEERKWDLNNNHFNGWSNYIIKRHPLPKWQSKEYTELSKDAELLELYNFISKVNKKAAEAGYIQNKGASIFLPFIRKSMAESLAWDFSLSAVRNWGDKLTLRADDVGYGAVNELTGELEHSIPKYYTTDFTRKEEGTNDYSDVSEDLFKNMILYINHMEKYKYLSDVEGQLELVKTIEEFKGHLNTGRSGELVLEDGKPKEFPGNAENSKLFDDFFRALLYEQKYPLSDSDIPLNIGKVLNFVKRSVNDIAGREVWTINETPTATSMVKAMDAVNRWYQVKTLGFEVISGAVNIFGGNIQVATQAGNYFKSREFLANEGKLLGNKFKHDDERDMFVQLIDKFMPLKDDPTYEKLRDSGMSALTRQNFGDLIYMFMRNPEMHLEKSVFLTLLQNMMIEEGRIVSIPEFVRAKYKDRLASATRFKEVTAEMNREIEELKKTRSIDAIKKLEDGKLVITGLDLTNVKELQRLTNLTRRISRNATGAMSNSDINRMGMNIWTKSMMVFKNWIPKLLDTRFSEFRKVADDFSVVIGEDGLTTGEKYDIGRIRLFAYVLSSGMISGIRDTINILEVNDKGLEKLDKMYEDFAEKYMQRTGQELNMTREDFIDLIRTNLRNQVKELAMLFSLFGAMMSIGFMKPPEDADKATKNFYRFSQRVVDKFITELSFFYNPAEFQRMLGGSAFPAIGVFKDAEGFITHFMMQTTGLDISNTDLTFDEVKKKAQPIKYAAKMFPITKSAITYFALFDAEFAKEFDVTVQRQINR